MNTSIEERVNALVEELGSIEDPQDRFVYLVEAAKAYPEYPDKLRIDSLKVPGCLSQLWIFPSSRAGLCYFQTDADAQIPKGIAVILVQIFDGQTAEDILACDLEFLSRLGIAQFLSPNRRNALSYICSYIRSYAEQVLGQTVSPAQAVGSAALKLN